MNKLFVLLAAILVFDAANAATVFPIATNPAVVNFGGGVGFDGTNYMAGFMSGANQNLVGQLISATNGSLIGSQLVVGTNVGFPPATALTFAKTNYFAAWSDSSVGSGVDISGQYISRSGAKIGSKFKLLSSAGSHGLQTVEATASDGTNFLAVWQDQNDDTFYGQMVTNGVLSGSVFTISSQSGNADGAYSASVAFGKTNYLVVWQSQNGGSSYQTYGAFISLNGHAGSPFQINQTASADQNPPAVAFDGTNYLVAWSWDDGSGSVDIYGRLVSQTGTFPGSELQLATGPGTQMLPTLAFDGANYLMAWSYFPGTGFGSGTNSSIYFQFFNRSGSPTNSEFTIFSAQGTNSPLLAGLIFDGTRFAAVATLGTVITGTDGNVTGLPSGEVFGAFIPSSTAVQVTTTSLPDGTTNVPYSQTLTASGGQTPYTWTLVSNSLPAGLSLSSGGVISGTPTTAITTNFIVQVKDNTNSIATQALSLTIDALDTSVVFTVTPSSVTNTYNGPIMLTVTGLKTNETVTVQKFLDANTNGVIDAGDLLVQQFNLTDGTNVVIGGVTNINVPGDLNPTNGAITAALNFQADFVQTLVGKYLLKLTSPSSHFTPITNSFAVTNFPFAQKFTGTVVSNGVAVPNAGILLFPEAADSNPVGGTVANNSGIYTIQMPAGTYSLVPFKANLVANFSGAPSLTLSNNATIITNLTLIPATNSISGQVVDAGNSGAGLPGLLVPVQPKDRSLLGTCFTDNNGNFTAGVIANNWRVGGDSAGPAFLGYVTLQNKTNVDTTTGSVSGVSIALPKATALFYGTVKDVFGNPLPGVVAIYADDNNNGLYEADGYTDTNGNYVTAAIGGLGNNDPWQLQIDNASSFPNYIFSQPAFDQNGGTNINAGQAVLANFTAIIATNVISGNVKFNGTNIVGVGVNAYATISNVNYNVNANTDTNGNYSFNVANGGWNVGVNQQGGSDSLDNMLGSGSYQPPNEQSITISNNNGVANFAIQGYTTFLSGQVLDDSGSPVTFMNVFALTNGGNSFSFQATTDSGGNFRMGIVGGNYRLFLNNDLNTGYPSLNLVGPNVPVSVTDGVNINNFILIAPRVTGTIQVQVNNPSDVGVSGIGVQAYLYVGVTNYTTYDNEIQTDGSGAASLAVFNGTWQVNLDVNDVQNAGYSTPPSQNITVSNNTPSVIFTLGSGSPLQITTASLPNGTNGTFYSQTFQASGGVMPYSWAIADYSALPSNLTLATNGVLSGTPSTAVNTYSFDVIVTDAAANSSAPQTMYLTIVNPPLPPLVITNVSLPNGNAGAPYSAQLGAAGGQTPYGSWQLAAGSAGLPLGLSLNFNSGLISGTPTMSTNRSFKVQMTDANSTTTNKVLAITINPKPVLGSPSWLTNLFQMRLTGASNQNYTLQLSTNLISTNWTSLFITNSAATNVFNLTDPNATNKQRFYRVLIGP